ncbi:hypothetical protein IW262DRAFT_1292477 [Armillaria fumosa]|nr:hypothetical protein IW262DRAFT_1292477 [Armillaria fumosa]
MLGYLNSRFLLIQFGVVLRVNGPTIIFNQDDSSTETKMMIFTFFLQNFSWTPFRLQLKGGDCVATSSRRPSFDALEKNGTSQLAIRQYELVNLDGDGKTSSFLSAPGPRYQLILASRLKKTSSQSLGTPDLDEDEEAARPKVHMFQRTLHPEFFFEGKTMVNSTKKVLMAQPEESFTAPRGYLGIKTQHEDRFRSPPSHYQLAPSCLLSPGIHHLDFNCAERANMVNKRIIISVLRVIVDANSTYI